VEIVAPHAAAKNIIYVTAPRWWLVLWGTPLAPPHWVSKVAADRATAVDSELSDRAVDDEPLNRLDTVDNEHERIADQVKFWRCCCTGCFNL